MSSRFDEYLVDYFLPTVREVLDPLLDDHGFGWIGARREVSARWASGDRFLEVSYLPETAPAYELLLATGMSGGSVGVWRLLPEEKIEEMAIWTFDDTRALERELRRAWREAIEPYVIPVWKQEGRLARIVAEHEREIDEEDDEAEREDALGRARAAFDLGRFDDVLENYRAAGDAMLKASDRKRIEIARKRRQG